MTINVRCAVALSFALAFAPSVAFAQAPPAAPAPERPAAETPAPPQPSQPVSPPPQPSSPPAEKPAGTTTPPGPQPHVEQPAPLAPGARLTGIAAWNALVGNSITGQTDDGLLTEFYAADGTVKSMTGTEISNGRWALVGEMVCFKFDDDDADCYKLEVVGTTVTFTDDDGDSQRFDILKGNPKNL